MEVEPNHSVFTLTQPFILWPAQQETKEVKDALDIWSGRLRWNYERLFHKVLTAPPGLEGIGAAIREDTHKFWFSSTHTCQFLFEREYLLDQILLVEEKLLYQLVELISSYSKDLLAVSKKLLSAASVIPTWLAAADGLFPLQQFVDLRKQVFNNFADQCMQRAQKYHVIACGYETRDQVATQQITAKTPQQFQHDPTGVVG